MDILSSSSLEPGASTVPFETKLGFSTSGFRTSLRVLDSSTSSGVSGPNISNETAGPSTSEESAGPSISKEFAESSTSSGFMEPSTSNGFMKSSSSSEFMGPSTSRGIRSGRITKAKATPAPKPSTSKASTSKPRGKKGGRKTKAEVEYEESPDKTPLCTCHKPFMGRMIKCESTFCEIIWYHFGCVGLTRRMPGAWFCPSCRGDSYKVPKKGY